MQFASLADLTDPSDWNNTQVPQLKELDSLKRCFICKEFFKAPVVTSCNHTFCLQCIREALIEKQLCPLCKTELYESNLRRDILLEEIVNCYSRIRPYLYDLLKKEQLPEIEIIEDSDDEEVLPKRIKLDLVECPVCSEKMTAVELQSKHLDDCLNGKITKKRKQTHSQPQGSGIASFFKGSPRNASPPVQSTSTDYYFKDVHKHQHETRKLSKLDFLSLTTPKIKEKLVALKLPVTGTRQQMEMRFNHWYVLYNSNLDSNRPVAEMILRQKLNQWELSINKSSKPRSSNINSANLGDKNFLRLQWMQDHKREYTRLIKAARKVKKDDAKEVEEVEVKSVDEENLINEQVLAVDDAGDSQRVQSTPTPDATLRTINTPQSSAQSTAQYTAQDTSQSTILTPQSSVNTPQSSINTPSTNSKSGHHELP